MKDAVTDDTVTYHDVYCNAAGCDWRGYGYAGAERAQTAFDLHWEESHLPHGRIVPAQGISVSDDIYIRKAVVA